MSHLALAFVVLGIKTAHADNCNVVAGGWVEPCAGICTTTGVPGSWYTVDCDTTVGGDTDPANATAVLKKSASEFQIWGTDSTNTPFCCVVPADPYPWDPNYAETFRLTGGSHADTLSFHYAGGGGVIARDLISPRNWVWLDAYMYGEGDDDTMFGSAEGINQYEEWLYGQAGDDTIDALGGSLNHLLGGADDDTLIGATTGWNTIEGDEGADTVFGGNFMNYIDGGGGNDCLVGGADNDQIFGGKGADTLIGNDGDDELSGQADNDLLDGGPGADSNSCGAGVNDSVEDLVAPDTSFCPVRTLAGPLTCP